ncbi:hypothetical protein ABZT06_44490 [Streptomyces sp. NPDC005483]|uniref:hypothetical protein n=1 Tax=Streptomyces sp. NPDC005483 TaxID=3154882 RepID=UPI0033AC09E3
MSTPPAIGKTASVKVDAQMYDDLETMLATGMNLSDALRSALLIVAGVYRKVWDAGAVPMHTRPTIERFWITRCDPGQWPAPGTAQTTVPIAYRIGPTPVPTSATASPTPDRTSGAAGPTPDPTRPMPRPVGRPPSHLVLAGGVTGPAPRPTPVGPDGPGDGGHPQPDDTTRGPQP